MKTDTKYISCSVKKKIKKTTVQFHYIPRRIVKMTKYEVLARMYCSHDSEKLLLKVLICPTALENSLTVTPKVEHMSTFTPGY